MQNLRCLIQTFYWSENASKLIQKFQEIPDRPLQLSGSSQGTFGWGTRRSLPVTISEHQTGQGAHRHVKSAEKSNLPFVFQPTAPSARINHLKSRHFVKGPSLKTSSTFSSNMKWRPVLKMCRTGCRFDCCYTQVGKPASTSSNT